MMLILYQQFLFPCGLRVLLPALCLLACTAVLRAQETPHAAALYTDAQELLANGQYAEGAIRLQRFAELYPEHPDRQEALVTLGKLQAGQLGRPEEAVRTYQSVISVYFPESPWVEQAHMNLGRVLITLGRTGEAHDALQRISKESPYYGEAQKVLKTLALSGVKASWWRDRNVLFLLISILETLYVGIWFSVGKTHPRSRIFWASFFVLLLLLIGKALFNFQLYTLVRG